jgi:hypothetical protein
MTTAAPPHPGPAVHPPRRWTSLIGVGLTLRLARRVRRLSDTDYWTTATARVQARQLASLLRAARDTEFGREHGFARLAALPHAERLLAFRRAVPLGDYYAFRTRIARMRENGEPGVLWPGRVMDFAQTSGTTAGDKYIPVSREMLRSNFLAALDIFAHAVRFGVSLPRILGGRALFLGGSTSLSVNEHGVRTGDLSGLVTPLIRWPISRIYSPGPDIALMSHWPSKIDAMAAHCLDQDIRMVSGMPSWALVLFDRVLALARERGRDARTIRDVWPNLDLFVHGGVKYAPFEPRVRQLFSGSPDGPDIPFRLELYPASEGFIAIQDTRFDPGLRLLADIGNFYEFVPLEEIDSPTARAFAADEVEKGQRYVVVMSTCAGLWRYIIGDVVEFDTIPMPLADSLADAPRRSGFGPCRLRIVGRHRHFINAFGENLIVEHIENAVAAAARQAGLVVGEFTAAPVYPGEGRRAGLELAVEIEPGPGGSAADRAALPAATMAAFRDAFDAALKRQNVDYTTKRTDDLGMAPPTITPLPPGTFHRWLQARGKLGGQHKCPRCANQRDILEGVVAAATRAGA